MKVFHKITSTSKTKISFYILGIASLVWFLVRVIPKPSRATYPCMRATAPFLSAFIVYLTGFFSAVSILKLTNKKAYANTSWLLVGLVLVLFSFAGSTDNAKLKLVDASIFKANQPMGVAKGIFPGRVVWTYDPAATNENMTNTTGDYWFMDDNCDQTVVENMLATSIKDITGKDKIEDAWDALFKYFNENHGKGKVGYTAGEKFAIKINLTNSCCTNTGWERMDASPQLMLAILKQLIEVVKVPQADIWIGDNYRRMRNEYYNKCSSIYPDVHYVDGNGQNGREQTKPSANQVLKFSDGLETASLPQHYLDAAYLINMPCLKTHNSAGITICAKNHQGSILHSGDSPAGQSAFYMHYCLPDQNSNTDQYRHIVDYMGHEQLGGKTLIYIVDGLWAGKNWEGHIEKWQMAPFNDDYPSSLFVSLDAVAIESVCFDFLLEEYASKDESEKYPYMSGVEDYLKQSSDPNNWPAGIEYDPEGDGSVISSLGVYEHWNNATDKQYSRNLGTGDGIELFKSKNTVGINKLADIDCKMYPNPFSESLYLKLNKSVSKSINLEILNSFGQIVYQTTFKNEFTWNCKGQNGSKINSGLYIVQLKDNVNGTILLSKKVIYNNR